MQRGFLTCLLFAFISLVLKAQEQSPSLTRIQGRLYLDDSWRREIFLSHIASMEEMYSMNSRMIVDQAPIDSAGQFSIEMNYLPDEPHLYRLHIVKKGDTPSTLIIGGKDENHFFLILSASSTIQFSNSPGQPPFKNINFTKGGINQSLHTVSTLVSKTDSLASESTQVKREFLEEDLNKKLLMIADTTDHFLLSLFALYKSKFAMNFQSNENYVLAYLDKWSEQENTYYDSLNAKFPQAERSGFDYSYYWILVLAVVVGLAFYVWNRRGRDRLKALSLQERKVYELLKEGKSNQEIADDLNIGVSTVKSHLTSIYSKLGVKSRKALVDFS